MMQDSGIKAELRGANGRWMRAMLELSSLTGGASHQLGTSWLRKPSLPREQWTLPSPIGWTFGALSKRRTGSMQVGKAPLPRPSPSLIRSAALTFSFHTALSGDFLHPRLVAWIDDEGLEALAELLMLIEEVGAPPMELLTSVFIDKTTGGKRPIGLMVGLMRLWGKVRRECARAWELENSRPYFWAGRGEAGCG